MEIGLRELEDSLSTTGEEFNEKFKEYKAAEEEVAAAVQARDEILYKYGLGNPTALCKAELAQADQVIEKAKAKRDTAALVANMAMTQAQTAAVMVNMKKASLRRSRSVDMTYVVYQARLECNFGIRESYLSLGSTHGVMTREIPQMTVKDAKLNTNIINFGGCRSRENPSVKEAARRAKDNANIRIALNKDWRDMAAVGVIVARALNNPVMAIKDYFCSKKEEDVLFDSLLAECIGECTACFPEFAAWENGHTKVTINGVPVLLRRCTMRCNWGGRITILLSGQPE